MYRYKKVATLLAVVSLSASAQWLHYPTPGIPRTRDGKPNLSAPAPRASNRRPDLSGVWQVEPTLLKELNRLFGDVSTFDVPGDDASLYNKYLFSVLADYPREESPILPEAARVAKQRGEGRSADLPTTRCCLPGGVPFSTVLPFPFKIIQTPGLMVVLYEGDSFNRQIFTDGRKHTADPQPTWMGYSTGTWEADRLSNGLLFRRLAFSAAKISYPHYVILWLNPFRPNGVARWTLEISAVTRSNGESSSESRY